MLSLAVRSFALHKLNLLPLLDRFAIWGPTIFGTKTYVTVRLPKRILLGVGIAKRPEIAPRDRIGHYEVIASKHVEMLVAHEIPRATSFRYSSSTAIRSLPF